MTALPASIDLLLTEPDAATLEDVEQQKIRAAQAGDMAAFEWLVQQHEERLFGFCCRWLRCAEDAPAAALRLGSIGLRCRLPPADGVPGTHESRPHRRARRHAAGRKIR